MKSGYEQHFRKVKQAAKGEAPAPRPASSKPRSAAGASPDATVNALLKAKRKRARRGPPWGFIVFSMVGLVTAVLGMMHAEEVESFAQRVEIGWLGSARAAESAAPSATSAAPAPAAATESAREPAAIDVDHLSKLNDRKKQLDAREAEIVRQEGELAKMKAELELRMKELGEMRGEISAMLSDRVKTDDSKVDNLVQMYTNMKPPQAAKVFETMDEDLAVEILVRMKKKNAAEIMNLLPAGKAQLFTERYAGYKK